MRVLAILTLVQVFAFGETPLKECVEFTEDVPVFSENELTLIDKYLPQIIETEPRFFANAYLSKIEGSEMGYEFYFKNLVHLRSHKCPDFIKVIMDGGFSVAVDLKESKLVLKTMVKSKNGKSWKLKK